MKKFLSLLAAILLIVSPLAARSVKGSVRSEGKPLQGVIVSDGYRFARTNSKGVFKLNTHKDARFVFVVTPSGYVAPFGSGTPEFYLPVKGTKSFDFNLLHFSNSPDYTLFAISDPQMANKKHIKRFKDAPLSDLKTMAGLYAGQRQTVAVALGDIAWNYHDVYGSYKRAVATVPIPFYPVIGNHDFIQNRSGIAAGEAYEASFGPYNYAFYLGNDLVICLKDLIFAASGQDDPGRTSHNMREGYCKETLSFLKSLLALVPKDTHLFVAQHSPILPSPQGKYIENYEEFLSILDGYKVDILSGHTHVMTNNRISDNVYDHNVAAIGGAWWATDWCRDGTPRGYEIFTCKDGSLSWFWHNIDYPDDYQVEFIPMGKAPLHPNQVVANVWDADPDWTVTWLEDGKEFKPAKLVSDVSMTYVNQIMEVYKGDFDKIPGYKKPRPTPHYYVASPSQYASYVVFDVAAPDGRKWRDSLSCSGYIDLQAHRGGAGLMPENTISSMRNAIDLRVNTLEFDLCVSADSQVVVSHDRFFHPRYSMRADSTLVQASDPREYLFKMPYDSIARYDVGLRPNDVWPSQKKVSEHKPLASDLIDFTENYAREKGVSPLRYNIEIKSTTGKGEGSNWPEYHKFVDICLPVLLSKNLGDRLVVQCFDRRALEYMHEKYPSVNLSFLTGDKETEITEILASLSFTPRWWSPHYSVVTAENVAYCHSLGIKVVPWTVDEPADIQRMADCGVDAIISNYPDRLISLLR